MYGIVARMPVTAMASDSHREPYRPPTKSAGVTKPCGGDTDHSRDMKTKMIGYTTIVYGTAKNPVTAPVANMAAGTATKVYAV